MTELSRQDKAIIRSEIEALNVEFAYLIDHDLSEQVAGLFTPGGSYGRITGERSVGREAIARAYVGRAARGDRTARHIFTNFRLDIHGADRVTGTAILLLFAEDGRPPHAALPDLVADYEDVYVRDGEGNWLFESRTVAPLFRRNADEPSVLPLGAS